MNMSASSRPTICTTLSSSGWSAPAWNTASCPAPACGVRRTPSLVPFQLAPTILSGRKNLLLVARPFSSLVREPSSNGSSNAVSTYLNRSPDCQLSGAAGYSAAERQQPTPTVTLAPGLQAQNMGPIPCPLGCAPLRNQGPLPFQPAAFRAGRLCNSTETQEIQNAVNLNSLPSHSQKSLIFPVREQPAHGARSHRRHLAERLLRDVDFDMAVHLVTYL